MQYSFAEQLNNRTWWHCRPQDNKSYSKRGIFLASSFEECEFYGRPLDNPLKVSIKNPLIGTEANIIGLLFGEDSKQMEAYTSLANGIFLKIRFKLDAAIFKAAKKKGYDAVALISNKDLGKVKEGKLPRSVELNVINFKEVIMNNSDSFN